MLAYFDGGKLRTAFFNWRRAQGCVRTDEGILRDWGIGPNAEGLKMAWGSLLYTYTARYGRLIDSFEAVRVVLAARRFYQKQHRWPTDEKDLVPAYVKSWPISALDGQALRWREDKRGIAVLDEDCKTVCTKEDCQFPFEPPVPAGDERKASRAR